MANTIVRGTTIKNNTMTDVYSGAMKRFEDISNIRRIARQEGLSERQLIINYCKQYLDRIYAEKVADLIMKNIA